MKSPHFLDKLAQLNLHAPASVKVWLKHLVSTITAWPCVAADWENSLLDAIYPPKTNQANETFAQHLWNHKDDLLTFLKHPGLDATSWRGELAIRFGVILRKVWCGNRTWTGARAQAVLMSAWRTCWQRGQNAINFLSHLLRRCRPELVGLPP